MKCEYNVGRNSILLIFAVLILISLVFALTITDDTQAEFQNGAFSNTTSNATGVLLDNTELTNDSNTVDLLHFNENLSSKTFGVNNKVNFTFYGDTNWTNNSKFRNSSIIFDGEGDYAKADQHFLTVTDLTVEFWFKLGESHGNGGGQKYLWLYHKDGNEYSQISLNNDGKLHYRFQATQLKWDLSTSQNSWNADKWHHAAVTCGSEGGKFYVDGSEIDTDPDTECLNDFGSSFTLYHVLGADFTGGAVSNEVTGSMDELKIYNKSLSASEITADFYSYHKSGTFMSDIKKAAANASWTDIIVNWTNSTGNNITFQVRSCDDSDCSGDSFIGSDNTSNTYFSSISVDLNTTNLTANQFFQYQIFFKTNDSGKTPILLKVSIAHNGTENASAPNITITNPIENGGFNKENVTFEFDVTDDGNLNNCSLYINGILNKSIVSPNKGKNNFNIPKLAKGKYDYTLECIDSTGKSTTTPAKKVYIILADKFSGTDLNTVDISNISNFLLQNTSSGSINFTGVINLTSVDDLNSYVTFEQNKIFLNSSALPVLNKSAILKLYNLTFSDPRILRNGEACPNSICTKISYSGGTLTFNVTQFSEYSSEEIPVSLTTKPATGGSCTRKFEIIAASDINISRREEKISATIENTGGCTLYDINVSLGSPEGWASSSEVIDRLQRHDSQNVTLRLTSSESASGYYNLTVNAKSGSEEENKKVRIFVLKPDTDITLPESDISVTDNESINKNNSDKEMQETANETVEEIQDIESEKSTLKEEYIYLTVPVLLILGLAMAIYPKKYFKKVWKIFKK